MQASPLNREAGLFSVFYHSTLYVERFSKHSRFKNVGKIMRKFIAITVISLLLLTACSLNRSGTPQDVGPEAFFRANLERTGIYQSPAVKTPTETVWEFQTEQWVDTAPAVVEDVVYFGSYDGNLYATNATTGSEIWRMSTNNPILSSPAVSGNTVYVGGMDGTLYALDRETGENRWNYDARGSVLASPAVANGLAYVGSESGLMHAVNIHTGQEAWHVEVGAPILFSAALADGLLLFSDMGGKLTAVQAINGEQVWQMQIAEGSTTSGPVIKDGIAYILLTDNNQKGSLYAIDLENQRINWQYLLQAESYSAPVVWEDLVIVADLSGRVTAVDQSSAIARWEFLAEDLIFSAPAMTNDTLYFGSLDQNLYAIDAKDGQEIWRLPLGSGVSSPAVFHGVLYVGTEKGKLVAISSAE